jgi:hypothetical protein
VYALSVSTSDVCVRRGVDEPFKAAAGQPSPSLKIGLVRSFGTDAMVGASWDVRHARPEATVAWAGHTSTEKAAVMLTADPLDRSLTVRAAVAAPGPEWRRVLYNEDTKRLEIPKDDGGRHRAYVVHTMRPRALLAATRAGARLDLGRALNWAADYADARVDRALPPSLWRIPGARGLYRLLVPGEDEAQRRYRISGWEVGLDHDFAASRPSLCVTKRAGGASLSASYDLEQRAASLAAGIGGGLGVTARAERAEGGGWGRPSLTLTMEPFGFL